MKVAFFSGPLEYSVCLANALSKHCEVSFFYGIKNAKDRDDGILNLLDSAIKKCPINAYRIRDIRNIFSYFKIARQLVDFDIIHIQNCDFWLSLFRPFFLKTPMVYTVHDPNQHVGLKASNKSYQDLAQCWGIKQSVHYIVHGEKLKEDLSRRYSLPHECISVVDHGEFSFYKKIRSNSEASVKKKVGEKRILFFGIIRKNKGLEYLIRAEPIISKKFENFKICIAGKFLGDRSAYEKMIKNADKFEIIDEFIPGDKVANLFENTDIVALPYITATQSGVLPLAFGFGKPVVATRTGSLSEVVEHGKTGLLIAPGEVQPLADAILDLLMDEKKCLDLGRNAAEFAHSRLGWDRISKETLDIYTKIISKN